MKFSTTTVTCCLFAVAVRRSNYKFASASAVVESDNTGNENERDLISLNGSFFGIPAPTPATLAPVSTEEQDKKDEISGRYKKVPKMPSPYPAPEPNPPRNDEPTPNPTPRPTPVPTPRPTPRRTPEPTPYPTKPPVEYKPYYPTYKRPTIQTRQPTPEPTPAPTHKPTVSTIVIAKIRGEHLCIQR